ncbi:DoxX-like family protein [Luteimonas sp. XNQY3]|nr:DoxX-like family protein [Luteimonas sp. XNQY3]MCD9007046.1 DoxX-like family protein [Luteimonas sp. XNQY3]
MSKSDDTLLRMGVVFVWLATAAVSVLEFDGQSTALLTTAGITDPRLVTVLISVGAGADLLVGIAMARWPSRRIYWIALALMVAMTVVASVLDPSLWLHPLGPLTKNVPIAAALWILIRRSA